MTRKLFLLLLAVFLVVNCNQKKDSLSDSRNDSIRKYLDLAEDYTLSSEKRVSYNDKAMEFVRGLKKSSKKTEFTYEAISNYHGLKVWLRYKKTVDFYKSILQPNDSKANAQLYRSYGNYYDGIKITDSAFYYYTKSESIYKGINDFEGYSSVLFKKGLLQYQIADFLAANLTLSKAYIYIKKTKDYRKAFSILVQLGLTSNELKEYHEAIDYFNDAHKIVKSQNLNDEQYLETICLSNIGLVYQNLKKHDKAIKYFKLSLTPNLKTSSPEAYCNIIDNLAYSKFQTNDYKMLPHLFYESLDIRSKRKDTFGLVVSNIHLSEFYNKVNQKQKALDYANESIRLSRLQGSPVNLLFSLKQGLVLDTRNSSRYADEFLKRVDSLQLAERNSKERFDRIQLKTDEIAQEKDTAIKQKWLIGDICGVIALMILMVLIINRQRSKQKELNLLQQQQKANEEIYGLMLSQKDKEEQGRQSEKKRIALELHDGVMNKLASARLNLDVLHHKRDNLTIEECLTHIDGLYKIEQEIRNISHDLTLEVFSPVNGFQNLMADFIDSQNKTFPTRYKLEMDASINWEIVSGGIKMNLFRIIQEASHNINKFAQAETAIITFVTDKDNICLSITDDGKGFDVEKTATGIGLKNIRQRVESFKGKLTIRSATGKGTSINIAIAM